jgi:hypothetical protein
MMQVTYPAESFFYPYHLIIALMTSAIFLIIVLSYRNYLIRQARKKDTADQTTQAQPVPPTPKADAVAVGSLNQIINRLFDLRK